MPSDVMNGVFKLRNTPYYNLRRTLHFSTDTIHSVYNENDSASYLRPKIWEQISAEIKTEDSFDGFKKEIKKWKPTECPCRIRKISVPSLSFVW